MIVTPCRRLLECDIRICILGIFFLKSCDNRSIAISRIPDDPDLQTARRVRRRTRTSTLYEQKNNNRCYENNTDRDKKEKFLIGHMEN